MRIYLDTNIIVSYFKPNDPHYTYSRKILDQADIHKVISFLTIIEFTSVIFRLQKGNRIELSISMKNIFSKTPQKYRAIILAKYIVRKFNLSVLGSKELLNFRINEESALFPLEFLKALSLSYESGLKTLDNLHIAIVALENKVSRIDYLVTGDRDILNKRNKILQITGCPVVSPSELTSILGLN